MNDPMSINAILFLGLALKFVGFAVRDELWLRALVMSGLACDAIFYGFRPEPVFQSVFTNGLLIMVNTALIMMILMERTTWRMSSDDRQLYAYFPTMTPGQFRRLRKLMTRQNLEPGSQLLREGAPVEDLLLILSDRIDIGKDEKVFPIAGPNFVGEVALLTGNPSSADVILPHGGTIFRIPILRLRGRMSRSPALANAIIALFGQELARKVADSVPMHRALSSGTPSGKSLEALSSRESETVQPKNSSVTGLRENMPLAVQSRELELDSFCEEALPSSVPTAETTPVSTVYVAETNEKGTVVCVWVAPDGQKSAKPFNPKRHRIDRSTKASYFGATQEAIQSWMTSQPLRSNL